jgi:hypothetical protein
METVCSYDMLPSAFKSVQCDLPRKLTTTIQNDRYKFWRADKYRLQLQNIEWTSVEHDDDMVITHKHPHFQ